MPDPHKDLAAIVEPSAPAAAPVTTSFSTSADLALPLVLACATVLLVVVAWWRWHRRAPLRALRRLARSADIEAGAAALARLMAARAVPDVWRQELGRLRFARPAPEAAAHAAATLARLCREAEGFHRF